MTSIQEPATALDPPPRPARLSERLQARGAALFFAIFGCLPLAAASAAGGALGRWIGPHLGISRRARRRLAAAFPERSAAEIDRILRGMWDNLGRVAVEYPHLRRIEVFAPGGPVEPVGFEHFDAAVAAGRRMIIFSGHIGNWELGPLASRQYGLRVTNIYRALNNPLVDRLITRLRGDTGEYVPKGMVAARRAAASLREGEHLALLADQKLNDGIAVPFFGRIAMTAPALAIFALRYDCDVFPARVERLGGARFRLTVYPKLELPRSGDRNADIAATMLLVNQTLESWIRERPEQWLWLHNRWPD